MERPSVRRLREEIRQSRPFHGPSHAAAVAILRTADTVRRTMDEAVEASGISVEQYNVLRILRGAEGKPMPVLEIAARLLEKNPGITRLLDKLESSGLVRRERCREDRRQVLCTITPRGLGTLARLDKPVEHVDRTLFAAVSAAEANRLIDLLDLIRHPNNQKEKYNDNQ